MAKSLVSGEISVSQETVTLPETPLGPTRFPLQCTSEYPGSHLGPDLLCGRDPVPTLRGKPISTVAPWLSIFHTNRDDDTLSIQEAHSFFGANQYLLRQLCARSCSGNRRPSTEQMDTLLAAAWALQGTCRTLTSVFPASLPSSCISGLGLRFGLSCHMPRLTITFLSLPCR